MAAVFPNTHLPFTLILNWATDLIFVTDTYFSNICGILLTYYRVLLKQKWVSYTHKSPTKLKITSLIYLKRLQVTIMKQYHENIPKPGFSLHAHYLFTFTWEHATTWTCYATSRRYYFRTTAFLFHHTTYYNHFPDFHYLVSSRVLSLEGPKPTAAIPNNTCFRMNSG